MEGMEGMEEWNEDWMEWTDRTGRNAAEPAGDRTCTTMPWRAPRSCGVSFEEDGVLFFSNCLAETARRYRSAA